MAALTTRGKALRWWTTHRGIKEDPPGSNRDNRKDGITAAQKRLGAWLVGLAWCGVWLANALLAAGVKGVTFRLASVALIEDDARAGNAPFRDWLAPTLANARRCLRGDAAVMFGRGVHVVGIRSLKFVIGVGWCLRTEEGNTSSGNAGSQSDGGMSTNRVRRLVDVHGFARVDYPGGAPRRTAARLAMLGSMMIPARGPVDLAPPERGSDVLLLEQLAASGDPAAADLARAVSTAQKRKTRSARRRSSGSAGLTLVELAVALLTIAVVILLIIAAGGHLFGSYVKGFAGLIGL